MGDSDGKSDCEAVIDSLASELGIETRRRLRMRNAAIRYRRDVREIKRLFVVTATRKDRQLDNARAAHQRTSDALEYFRNESENLRNIIRIKLTISDVDIDAMLLG